MHTDPAPASTAVSVTALDEMLVHRAWIRRLALRLARDENAADDLEQDAWLAALRHPPSRDGVRSWFRTVVRNRARNVRRDDDRREARELRRGAPSVARSTVDAVAEADAHRHVVDAVMDLDEPYRTSVILRYFEQLPVGEVARRTDAPLETARARLRRARERLRERLDGEFGSRAAWCLPLLAGWHGPRRGSRGRSATAATAASLLGGLIVNKLIVGAAVVALLGAMALWISSSDDPVAPPQSGGEVASVDATEPVGRREHGARNRTDDDRRTADAAAATAAEDESVADDPVEAARKRMDALPHREITGVVRDVDGRPLAGAVVRGGNRHGPNGGLQDAAATAAPASTVSTVSTGAGDVGASESPSIRIAAMIAARYSVETKEDGTFSMHVPILEGAPDAEAAIVLWASAEGHATAGVPVPEGVDSVELRLKRAVQLRVRLLDGDGRPVVGRALDVQTEFDGVGTRTSTSPTDEAGWGIASALPAGAVVTVRTRSAVRVSDLRETVRLPDEGEFELVLRDNGLRRVRVIAVVDDEAIPVAGLLVQSQNGGSEIRAWPGGREATVELPDGEILLGLSTAVGQGEMVPVPADALEIELRLAVPPHRWVEVAIGDRDPMNLSLVGTVRGRLALMSDLRPFVTDGGALRLPIVDGGGYAIREKLKNRYRLFGSVGPARIDLDAPQHTVPVRVIGASGRVLPPGTTATAAPLDRRSWTRQAGVEGTVGPEGAIALSVVPGITYALVVRAPGMAAARVEHRAGDEGGDVPVTLQAGEPLRIAIDGLAAGSRTSVVTFPDFGRVASTVKEGHVVVEGVHAGWVLVMAAGRVVLVDASGSAPRRVPAGAIFTPDASAEAASRTRVFLIGTAPLADGVFPVGLVGGPFGVPEGRYVPVEWTREDVVVHAPVHLSADAPTWKRPADDDVEWTRGEHGDASAARVVITAEGARLPVGYLSPKTVTRWRSAGLEVSVEPVQE